MTSENHPIHHCCSCSLSKLYRPPCAFWGVLLVDWELSEALSNAGEGQLRHLRSRGRRHASGHCLALHQGAGTECSPQ